MDFPTAAVSTAAGRRTPKLGSKLIALAAFLAACALFPASAGEDIPIASVPQSGVTFTVTRLFESPPPFGYQPLRIKIHNTTASAHAWSLKSTANSSFSGGAQNSFVYEQTLRVQPRSDAEFEISLPLPSRDQKLPSYTSVELALAGYGLPQRQIQTSFSSAYSRHPRTPYIIMSVEVGLRSYALLEKFFENQSVSLDGARVALPDFPTDFRAYTGVASLWISDADWRRLGPEQRQAISDWVALGGTAFVCTLDPPRTSHAQLGLPEDGTPAHAWGIGRFVLQAWDGLQIEPENVAETVRTVMPLDLQEMQADFTSYWGLGSRIEPLGANNLLVMVFIIVFAVLIGPVNLFVFAGSNHRYRLFWTTPLISVGASFVLAAIIVLADGFGGSGRRMLACFLLAGQPRLVLLQEQISRTAVLLSTSFKLPEQTAMLPVSFATSSSATTRVLPSGKLMTPDRRHQAEPRFEFEVYGESAGDAFGSWFRSRAVQAQWMAAPKPTRAQIDLLADTQEPGSAPVMVSSIATPLVALFYIAPDETYWKAENVAPGVPTSLSPCSRTDYLAFLDDLYLLAGGRIKPALDSCSRRPGYFYAVAAQADEALPIPTLPAVEWTTKPALYIGTPVLSAPNP